MKFILGLKLGFSQIFNEEEKVIPVTLIEAGPCIVTQIKTEEKDDYGAVQIGFGKLKARKIHHVKFLKEEISPKAKLFNRVKKTQKQKQKPFKYLREFKGDVSKYKVGDKINVSIFQEKDKVKVSGVSKGKGFAGAVKRWGFKGRGASHGVKHEARTIGSVGTSFPERVIKGKKMPGRMGGARVTIKNLKVVKIDPKNNLLAVKGAVPGRKGALLEIRSGS